MTTLTANPAMKARIARVMPAPPARSRTGLPSRSTPPAPAPASRPAFGFSARAENSLLRRPGAPIPPEPLERPAAPASAAPPDADAVAARRAALTRQSDIYMELRKLSPALFAGERPLPLMVGIHQAIIDRLGLDSVQDRIALRVVLHNHTQWRAYQLALAAEGAMRHGLDGNPVEPVSDEHRAQAQDTLEKLKRKTQTKEG